MDSFFCFIISVSDSFIARNKSNKRYLNNSIAEVINVKFSHYVYGLALVTDNYVDELLKANWSSSIVEIEQKVMDCYNVWVIIELCSSFRVELMTDIE